MNRRLASAGLLICLSACAQATRRQPDLVGWGKIRWNMTIQQAAGAYGAAATVLEVKDVPGHVIPRVALPDTAVLGIPFHVTVQSDSTNSDQVSGVTLRSGSGSKIWHRERVMETLFESLVQKYGAPVMQDVRKTGKLENRIFIWVMPSTSIKLSWEELETSADFGSVQLEYAAPDKKSLDVL